MKEYLSCFMDISEMMLLAGAEVRRVEDGFRRMCCAVGARRTDIFIITSSIVATVCTEDGTYITQTRRITGGGTDLERLHRLNALSRRICSEKLSPGEIQAEIARIRETPVYPFAVECLAYAVIASSFTLFFGGTWVEAAVSLVVGALLRFIILLVERTSMSRIFAKFLSALAACLLADCAMRFHWIPNIDTVMIGTIMTLTPGIGLTNALRDLFVGDSIAGSLRFIDAVLTALAIAAGYFLYACTLGGVIQ